MHGCKGAYTRVCVGGGINGLLSTEMVNQRIAKIGIVIVIVLYAVNYS
jgi:hypothetical protein